MPLSLKHLILFSVTAFIASCDSKVRDKFEACEQRLGDKSTFQVNGQIFGPVGEKVSIVGCGEEEMQIVMIGVDSHQHEALVAQARTSETVVRYSGFVLGYLVRERGSYFLLAEQIYDVSEKR